MSSVTTEYIEGALVIRLDRPEQKNPLSSDVIDELLELIAGIENTSITKCIFTGMGDAFASGANLREISELTPETAPAFARRGQKLMNAICGLSVPSIAAINGYCFGGGLDLALACGMRIASPNAVFCHPGVGLGIITGWGGTQRLPRLVGEGIALEMLMTAARVSATEALRIGLIDKIADDVLSEALNLDQPIV